MALHDGRVNWPLFFGCILIAFGPLAAFFFVVVGQRAQLMILALSGAFVWMVSILVTSTLWQIPALGESLEATLAVGIVLQEIARYVFFVLYTRTERAVQKVTTSTHQLPLNDLTSSIAGGVGFALMHSLMMYGSMIAASTGARGAAFSDSCPGVPLVFSTAFMTLALTVLDVALMVIAFDGYRKKSIPSIAFVIIVHLGVGLSALANKSDNGCTISIPIHYAGALLASGAAYVLIGRWKQSAH
ncbi:TPA: hypothetical protein N0F65_002371 [Lagenidium giganteum]|uniref:Gamma-secretase subunit Aph-1 n=1 Tax=Lagenidium giganteum TaxID=4803 RepID=A0AAV2YPG1_9STRA|nr:TPA: hypothetical protein N0F65_002371 [Lagenidium giganteum]